MTPPQYSNQPLGTFCCATSQCASGLFCSCKYGNDYVADKGLCTLAPTGVGCSVNTDCASGVCGLGNVCQYITTGKPCALTAECAVGLFCGIPTYQTPKRYPQFFNLTAVTISKNTYCLAEVGGWCSPFYFKSYLSNCQSGYCQDNQDGTYQCVSGVSGTCCPNGKCSSSNC